MDMAIFSTAFSTSVFLLTLFSSAICCRSNIRKFWLPYPCGKLRSRIMSARVEHVDSQVGLNEIAVAVGREFQEIYQQCV